MQIVGLSQKVTIYIGEGDRWQRKPLYMAILDLLRAEDCAGATVTRGLAGFGAHSRIHTASLVALSADLPLVIEWVDSLARVERVMPRLQAMVTEGLITVQDVEVVTYSHRRLRHLPASLPVSDVMSRELHTVAAATPLAEIVELLLDKVYRALPVVDEAGRIIGLITEGDLLSRARLLATSAQRALTRAELTAMLSDLRQTGQTAADIMTTAPITVSGDVPVAQAVELMLKHNVKRLPVVDNGNRPSGIISRIDVLRALSQPAVTESPRQSPAPGHHTVVKTIMQTNVPAVQADDPLTKVVGLLVSSVRRRVVVVDGAQRVVGIITDGDLIKRAAPGERSDILQALIQRLPLSQPDGLSLSRRTAAQVMTAPVVTVTPDTPILNALQLLLTRHIKRLPVVDAQGKLVGLVGRAGMLQALGIEAGQP